MHERRPGCGPSFFLGADALPRSGASARFGAALPLTALNLSPPLFQKLAAKRERGDTCFRWELDQWPLTSESSGTCRPAQFEPPQLQRPFPE